MDVAGKNVIISGAARGIGKQIAIQMAVNGANVLINTRNPETLKQVLEEAKSVAKGKVVAYLADVGNREEVEAMFDYMIEELGGVDVVVNNAAIVPGRGFLAADEVWFDNVIKTNLYSVFYMSHRAAKEMVKRGAKGSIINFSSIGSTRAHRNSLAYDTSKGGIDAFTRALALELGPWEIRVNAISPACILGAHVREMTPERVAEKNPADFVTPIPRQGTPEDIANLVQFLASEASGYITGQVLSIDGGMSIQARPYQINPLLINPQNFKEQEIEI